MALLAVQRTGAADYGKYIKALLCGNAGSGKTMLSSTFPNPWFLSAEGGLMSIADRDIPYTKLPADDGTVTSEALLQVKARLEQSPAVREKQFGFPVDTLVVDTIDEISRLLLSERMKKEKHDIAQLQDYGWLKDRMTWFVTALRHLDMHVVFTCHLKPREIDGSINLIPAIEGGFSEKIADYVDLALVLKSNPVSRVVGNETVRVIERRLQTFPDAQTPWLKDRSGKLPHEIPVNFDDDFERIAGFVYADMRTPAAPEPIDSNVEPEVSKPVAVDETPAPDASEGRYTCSECDTTFDDEDAHDRGQIRHGRVICAACFKKVA